MRLVHWAWDGRRWPRRAAAAALVAGGLGGVLVAWHLPVGLRAYWAARVLAYAARRAQGRGAVFRPALDGWLRTAAPIWAAGLWPRVGAVVVLVALGLHAFSLAFGVAVAGAAGGWAGLHAGVLAVLPGNLLALPALWWLGSRAVDRAAARNTGRPSRLGPYVQVGAGVLLAVTCSSLGEAALGPLLLRLGG